MDNVVNVYMARKAFTHGGLFHADDVFASALLEILNPEIVIERGNKVPDGYDGIVFDIGMGRYDHHQHDKRYRDNGVPYAAFGLLWDDFGELILEKNDAKLFDEVFVQPIDLTDNTGDKNMLSQCISDFNPVWNEHIESNAAFEEAVIFAKEILEKRFRVIKANREAYNRVRAMMPDDKSRIFIMKEAMPWKEAIRGTDIMYVIFPSIRGGYMVQAVPDDEDKNKLKKPFPENWRGKNAEELRNITGIETFNFCHISGFLCSTGTLEDATKVAKKSLNNEGE
jgi:uncharacterized UPF0160 family protein